MSVATPRCTARMHVSPCRRNARGSRCAPWPPPSGRPPSDLSPFQPGATSPDSEMKPQPRRAEGTMMHQAVQGLWRGS